MWTRAPRLKVGLALLALALSLAGCGAARDPYGQQVKQVHDLARQGEAWFAQGEWRRAQRDFNRALDLSRAVDYPTGAAQQLNNLGAVALEQGDLPQARELFQQALAINRERRQWAEACTNLANLATVAQKAGDWPQAEDYLRQAMDAAEKSLSPAALAQVRCRWAGLAIDHQDYAMALASLEAAQSLAKGPELQGMVQYQWGRLALAQGDAAMARQHFQQALAADRQTLNRAAMAADLFSLGETYAQVQDWPQAFEFFSRAFGVYASLGKTAQLKECLKRLDEANRQGRLGRSLKSFETHPRQR
jgi:tetratricopeptide (TPR) repeat protein